MSSTPMLAVPQALPARTAALRRGLVIALTAFLTVVDLFAQYQATENAIINLNIDNVFDETYRQHLDQYNSAGLNARIGLTMRLGAQ